MAVKNMVLCVAWEISSVKASKRPVKSIRGQEVSFLFPKLVSKGPCCDFAERETVDVPVLDITIRMQMGSFNGFSTRSVCKLIIP